MPVVKAVKKTVVPVIKKTITKKPSYCPGDEEVAGKQSVDAPATEKTEKAAKVKEPKTPKAPKAPKAPKERTRTITMRIKELFSENKQRTDEAMEKEVQKEFPEFINATSKQIQDARSKLNSGKWKLDGVTTPISRFVLNADGKIVPHVPGEKKAAKKTAVDSRAAIDAIGKTLVVKKSAK